MISPRSPTRSSPSVLRPPIREPSNDRVENTLGQTLSSPLSPLLSSHQPSSSSGTGFGIQRPKLQAGLLGFTGPTIPAASGFSRFTSPSKAQKSSTKASTSRSSTPNKNIRAGIADTQTVKRSNSAAVMPNAEVAKSLLPAPEGKPTNGPDTAELAPTPSPSLPAPSPSLPTPIPLLPPPPTIESTAKSENPPPQKPTPRPTPRMGSPPLCPTSTPTPTPMSPQGSSRHTFRQGYQGSVGSRGSSPARALNSEMNLQGSDGGGLKRANSSSRKIAKSDANQGSRVQVAIRIRPFTAADGAGSGYLEPCLSIQGNVVLPIHYKEGRSARSFSYDHIFQNGQDEIFNTLGDPMLDNLFSGYNVCLFAYGQTGSGKTYSIHGTANNEGLVPRIGRAMLQRVNAITENASVTCTIKMSYIEIYNEKCRDLLETPAKGEELSSLTLYEREGQVRARDLSWHAIEHYEEIVELVAQGMSRRQTSATSMNEASSRSHSILQFILTQTSESMEERCSQLESTCTLVDLAGSERVSKSELAGLKIAESKNINRSLLCLGRAMNHFSKGNVADKVPFLRASKLTRLLSDCFGGNSRTWMLATVSPSVYNLTETLSTLEYAYHAKHITNHAKINRVETNTDVAQLQEMIVMLNQEIDGLLGGNTEILRNQIEEEYKAELVAQVQQWEDEKAELWNEMDRLMKVIETLEEGKRALESSKVEEGTTSKNEIAKLKKKCAKLDSDNLELKRQTDEQALKVTKISEHDSQLATKCAKLESENKKLKRQMEEQALKATELSEQQNSQLATKNAKLESENKKLKRQMEEQALKVTELSDQQNSQLATKNAKLESENIKLKRQLDEQSQNLTQLTEQHKKAGIEVESLMQDNKALADMSAKTTAAKQALRADLVKYQEWEVQMVAQHQAQARELAIQIENNRQLQETIATVTQENQQKLAAQHEQYQDQARDNLKALKSVADIITSDITAQQSEVSKEQQMIMGLKEAMVSQPNDTVQSKVDSLSDQLRSSREEVSKHIEASLQEEIKHLQQRNQVLTRLLSEQSSSKMLSQNQWLLTEIRKLTSEKEDMQQEIKVLNSMIEEQAIHLIGIREFD